MWRRSVFGVLLANLVLVALATPAFAGGWAVTVLDDVPATVRAGESFRIGYTVLQHGKTPAAGLDTAIQAASLSSGETFRLSGAPDGAPGHYVAEVRFPEEGQWTWEVLPGWFAPQSLGTITVHASLVAAASPALLGEPTSHNFALDRQVLPIVALGALALFGWQLAAFIRPRTGVREVR